jgi:TPR repeat protein
MYLQSTEETEFSAAETRIVIPIRNNSTILVLIANTLSFPTVYMYHSLFCSSPSQLTDTQRSALSVLTEAAMDDNCADAQCYLGECYEGGHGVGMDEKRAAKLYSMAASQGDYIGQYFLGLMYLHGRGVPKDTAMAESWLSKSEENNLARIKELPVYQRDWTKGL